METSANIVEYRGVTKVYPARWPWTRKAPAVTEVSLTIGPGEVVGLIGPNRAGKTTLVKLLLSLCRPTSGKVVRFGKPSTDRSTLRRVGYVHESPAFPRYLSASDLLDYYGALALVPPEDVRLRAWPLLEQVGLADRAREPIARFSKGMVQRLALAQALLNAPDLLVLDEPNEGLDLAGRRLVRELIGEQRRRGRSVLLVSHLLVDIEQLCDRVAVLAGGRLVFNGPVAELLDGHDGAPGQSLEHALAALYEAASP